MRTAAARRELGFPKSDELPGQWTWELVNLRLVEAFEAEPNLAGERWNRESQIRDDHLYEGANLGAQEEVNATRARAARVKLLPHQVSLVLVTLNWTADYIGTRTRELSRAADPAHASTRRRLTSSHVNWPGSSSDFGKPSSRPAAAVRIGIPQLIS